MDEELVYKVLNNCLDLRTTHNSDNYMTLYSMNSTSIFTFSNVQSFDHFTSNSVAHRRKLNLCPITRILVVNAQKIIFALTCYCLETKILLFVCLGYLYIDMVTTQ